MVLLASLLFSIMRQDQGNASTDTVPPPEEYVSVFVVMDPGNPHVFLLPSQVVTTRSHQSEALVCQAAFLDTSLLPAHHQPPTSIQPSIPPQPYQQQAIMQAPSPALPSTATTTPSQQQQIVFGEPLQQLLYTIPSTFGPVDASQPRASPVQSNTYPLQSASPSSSKMSYDSKRPPTSAAHHGASESSPARPPKKRKRKAGTNAANNSGILKPLTAYNYFLPRRAR